MSSAVDDDDIIARWSARRLLYAAVGFLAIVFLLILLALVARASDTPAWLGLLALLVIAGLAVGLVQMAVRSEVVLTTGWLRTHGRRGGENALDLSRLRGVAVVRALPGWAIFVWPEDGVPSRLASPERVFRFKAQSLATADPAYWSRLANSPAGVAAARIYQQSLAVQGPTGALKQTDTAALITRDRRLFRGTDVRWWSPDGNCGEAT